LPLGLRVILAEYPGYGPRVGTLSEASLVADAGETIALTQRQYGGPVLLIGESLGAAVAAAAAAAHPQLVSGLLLITPWDQLAQVGAYHYPWLPVRWLLRDEYDSVTRLQGFERPVIVAVAERDRIVPARFGIALYRSLDGPKHLLAIPGSGHNDWPDRVDASWWRDVVARMLEKVR
jgi:pimeloyl-ACP methyl ester carboxylesterase